MRVRVGGGEDNENRYDGLRYGEPERAGRYEWFHVIILVLLIASAMPR